MGLQDLPFVTHTHATKFPDGFFTRLGTRFITRYYRTFLDGPLATAIVGEINGTTVGYLVGVIDTRRHRRLVLTYHGTSLAFAAALGMALQPQLALTFVWTRSRRYLAALRRQRHNGAKEAVTVEKVAVLSHLAVVDSATCHGVGTALVEEFVSQASSAGCARACLVTRAENTGAMRFYGRRGWTRTDQRRSADGIALVYYTMDLGC